MIIKSEPLSMTEAMELVKSSETENPELTGFCKKFVVVKPADAKEIRKKIQELNFLKVKSEHIAKIIDLMPENATDLNKIFMDVKLDENETNKILEIIKQFK